MTYTVRELSLRTFPDFETLAIKQGGCWCMFYQRSKPVGRGTTSDQWKRINRRDKRTFVRQGRSHAILVYDGRTPVGWCQYGGQEELPRIDARRTYRKVARQSRTRSCGGSRASSSIRSFEGEVLRSSPFVPRSIRLGTKEEESWKRTRWLHRRWPPSPSGGGSGRRTCSGRKASALSPLSGRVVFS